MRGLVRFAIKRDYVDGLDPMRGIDNPRPYRPGPVNAANDAELVALFRTPESSAVWPLTLRKPEGAADLTADGRQCPKAAQLLPLDIVGFAVCRHSIRPPEARVTRTWPSAAIKPP